MTAVKLIPQSLLDDIERERHRQESKFPGQVLPATYVQRWSGEYFDGALVATRDCGLPRERQAKEQCDYDPDWAKVLVEEVSEAVSAAGRGDANHTREELIQVAAVAIRWIGAIDRGEVGF